MIIAFFLMLLENYLFLLPIGFKPGFLFLYIINVFAVAVFEYFIAETLDVEDKMFGKLPIVNASIGSILTIVLISGGCISSPVTQAHSYHNCIEITTHEDEEDLEGNIPDMAQINKVSLMDTKSAEKLGDRTLGALTDLVSQYTVGEYYTICIDGEIRKIAPLEYNGFFKWMANKTIPGYVLVNPLDNTAEYVELEKGIKYSQSAYFDDKMMRQAYRQYKSEYLGDYSFQVDDEGNPYWVITTLEPQSFWSNKIPDGVLVMDACNGAVEKYNLDKIPEWVDLVFSGYNTSTLYNRYGKYINGFWNSIFSETGITQVTDDFGYIAMEDDIYIYTGITSVSNDESNLGFILVNSRTGDFDYYPIAGAEEYSAMGAAEGIVQNYGYQASFPSLIMVDDNIPTYVMVLKDSNGLVKQYAMVNYKNYTIVVVANTLDTCLNEYMRVLNGETVSSPALSQTFTDVTPPENLDDGRIVITRILFITEDGQTYCYINTSAGKVLKAKFDESQLLLNIGDDEPVAGFDVIQYGEDEKPVGGTKK